MLIFDNNTLSNNYFSHKMRQFFRAGSAIILSVIKMTVYLDVLIVMNIYISYFTLRAAGRLLHTETPFRRTAAASVFGGLSSLAALADIGTAGSFLLKAALTAVTVLIAFGAGSLRLFAVRTFVCVTIGMLICGSAVLIHELTGSDMVFAANGYVCLNISALVLVISSAVIYGVLCFIRRISDSPDADERINLAVSRGGSTVIIEAVCDSGNYLRDFLTGRPVILCREAAVRDILPPGAVSFLAGDDRDVRGLRLIPMRTASGSGIAAAFLPDSLTAEYRGEKKKLDALVGVCRDALSAESFDAVMSPKLLK